MNKDCEILTRKEAATYLGVSPSTMSKLTKQYRYDLPFFKCKNSMLFKSTDLDEFIDFYSEKEFLYD